MAQVEDHRVEKIRISGDPNARTGVAWGLGNSLFFYKTKLPGSAVLGPQMIHTLAWPNLDAEEDLLTSWHEIFCDIQYGDGDTSLTQFCERYRRELSRHAENLKPRREKGKQDNLKDGQKDDLKKKILMLNLAESIFHLCEIFYISEEGYREGFLGWYKRFTRQKDKKLREMTRLDGRIEGIPRDSKQLWDYIYRFIAQGRNEQAVDLIKGNISDNRESRMIVELLGITESLKKAIKHRYSQELHAEWREQVNLLAASVASFGVHLQTVVRIFTNLDVLQKYSRDWKDFLAGFLLYHRPTAAHEDIKAFTEMALKRYKKRTPPGSMDDIIRLILELDVTSFIQHVNQVFDMQWFTAHLTDLLSKTSLYKSLIVLDDEMTLRESLLLEYVESLMGSKSMWILAPQYLQECVQRGPMYLRELLRYQPLTSDRKVLRLVHICNKYGMNGLEREICSRYGAQLMRSNKFGDATKWLLKAGDQHKLGHMCNTIFERFTKDESVIRDINSVCQSVPKANEIQNQFLSFLIKYKDFHSLMNDWHNIVLNADDLQETTGKDVTDALCSLLDDGLGLIISLLIDEVAPVKYMFRIFHEMVPLLEFIDSDHDDDDARSFTGLSPKESAALKVCLERICESHDSEELLDGYTQNDVRTVRLWLTKASAFSFVDFVV